eukprot:6733199-Pyramimonas_sp.AAC.1
MLTLRVSPPAHPETMPMRTDGGKEEKTYSQAARATIVNCFGGLLGRLWGFLGCLGDALEASW